MKLSINLLCATGLIQEEHLPLLDLAKQIGYDGVEIPVLAGTPEHYAWLGAELDARDLERTCTAICPDPETNPISADAAARKRGLAHLDWILDCAQALGAQTIGGPFHAPIGHFTGAGPTEDELLLGIGAHVNMAEKAANRNMTLALEPLNRFETYFLNTAEQARSYVDRVDHKAFGIMYDTFHAHIEEKDQSAAIATLGDAMAVLHVSENDRGIPGTGQIDFLSLFASAKKTGFDGWVVIEAFGSGVPELAAATRIWRQMFSDHDTLFKQSHDFLRKTWSAA